MRALQQHIITDLQVSPAIDAGEQVRDRTTFLVDYLRASGATGLVLGISGGQDSTLAGRIAQLERVDPVAGGDGDLGSRSSELRGGSRKGERAALHEVAVDTLFVGDPADLRHRLDHCAAHCDRGIPTMAALKGLGGRRK